MRKSIELGRAVLSTSTANLELWLRTLITISPQQQGLNLEQRDAASIVSLLSSNEVWVGRGTGLYIDLDLTLRGQPLAGEQLQQLSEALLEAPAWAQLNLKPSLPYDTAHELGKGKLRIMINHSNDSATLAARQRHRVLSNISAADVRPPEGVLVFYLDSVVFCMDVFELTSRRTTSTAKRLKTSMTSNDLPKPKISQDIEIIDRELTDTLLFESNSTFSPLLTSSTLKRPRPLVPPTERTAASPITPPKEACETQETQIPHTGVESTSMQTLIDGALRLSVLSSINSKMLTGIKIKANTFGPGLADLVPTLWKPNYSWSLSQRASLLPTISRSLCQLEATARTTSISLKQKLSALAARVPSLQPPVHIQGRDVLDRSYSSSSIAPHLWLHLQKHTPCKPATSLQSFFAAGLQSTPLAEDILEEPWQETVGTRRSRPSSVGLGASGVDQSLESCPAVMVACDGRSSKPHLLGAVASPESFLEGGDDELLLGAECFEDANLLAFRGSEVS